MKKTGFLGLDLGGTGVKAGVYDENGILLGFGQGKFSPVTDADGHTETPIEDIYAASRDAVRSAVKNSGADILAMAVASQGETFVTLDENDKPLHQAIMWYDSRGADYTEKMRYAILDIDQSASMPMLLAICTAPKILWLRDQYPEAMSHAKQYLLLPEFISYKLTGVAVTDPCTAESSALYVADTPDYDEYALQAAQIEKSSLARIQQSGTKIAKVLSEMAEEWGLSTDTWVVTGTNDQYAGALGAGNCRPGIVSETTGTCLALVTLTEKLPEPMPDGIFGGRFPIPEYQFALAYSKTAGLLLDWYSKEFAPGKSLKELDKEASNISPGSNGLTFLPHFDGMVSPTPNPNTRGYMCNLSLNHTSAHVYRAILESLSFSLRENIELLQNNGFNIELIRSIGGGAKSDLWLQMKSDVMGLPLERPKVAEAATLGAAMLAAVGVGAFSSAGEASSKFYHAEKVFEPDTDNHQAYQEPYNAYRNLCRKIYW